MSKISFFLVLFLISSFAESQERTIQSTYSGFTKSCVAFSHFEKKKDFREYISVVEKYADKIPDYELNKRLTDGSDEIAQIKLFSPYSFFKPRRSVSGSLDCNKNLELFLSTETKKEGVERLVDWNKCISNLSGSDSRESQIATQVLECLKD